MCLAPLRKLAVIVNVSEDPVPCVALGVTSPAAALKFVSARARPPGVPEAVIRTVAVTVEPVLLPQALPDPLQAMVIRALVPEALVGSPDPLILVVAPVAAEIL